MTLRYACSDAIISSYLYMNLHVLEEHENRLAKHRLDRFCVYYDYDWCFCHELAIEC